MGSRNRVLEEKKAKPSPTLPKTLPTPSPNPLLQLPPPPFLRILFPFSAPPSSCNFLPKTLSFWGLCELLFSRGNRTCRGCVLGRGLDGVAQEGKEVPVKWRAKKVSSSGQNSRNLNSSANKGLPPPLGRGVCETKSKNGRSRPRNP